MPRYVRERGRSRRRKKICSTSRRCRPSAWERRVFGRIHHWQRDPFEEQTLDYGPLEGLVVNVSGAGFSRDAVTDRHGRYEIAGLPLGVSTLTVAAPHGFDSRGLQRELDLGDLRACNERNFELRYVASASGSVVDAAGRALAGIRVEAVAAELAGHRPPPYQEPAITDERGAFEFERLPPGIYVFGVNLTTPRYGRATDEPAVFLPGVAVASDATAIELRPGDRTPVGVLRLNRSLTSSRRAACAIGCHRLHHRQGKCQQPSRVEQETLRVADSPAVVAGLGQIRVHEPREEAVGPVRMRPVAGIELLHVPPDACAAVADGHLEPRHALARDVDDVLGVVKEGHGVVIAAEQQDLAVERDEPIEGRGATEGVVPRLLRVQVLGMPAPRDKARDVMVDSRTRIRAKEFDEGAVLALGPRRQRDRRPEASPAALVPARRSGFRVRSHRSGRDNWRTSSACRRL